MNLLLAELEARYLLEASGRELEPPHYAEFIERPPRRRFALRERLTRMVGRARLARLVRRSSAV